MLYGSLTSKIFKEDKPQLCQTHAQIWGINNSNHRPLDDLSCWACFFERRVRKKWSIEIVLLLVVIWANETVIEHAKKIWNTDWQHFVIVGIQQPTRRSNTSAVAGGLSLGAAVLLGSFVLGALWWRRRNNKQVFFDVNGDWSSTLCGTYFATQLGLISCLPSSHALKTQNLKTTSIFWIQLAFLSPLPLAGKGRKMGPFDAVHFLNCHLGIFRNITFCVQHGQFDTKCDVSGMSLGTHVKWAMPKRPMFPTSVSSSYT